MDRRVGLELDGWRGDESEDVGVDGCRGVGVVRGSGTRVSEVGRILDADAVSFSFTGEAGTDRDLAFSMSLPTLLRPVRFFMGSSSCSSLFLFVEENRVGGNLSPFISWFDL